MSERFRLLSQTHGGIFCSLMIDFLKNIIRGDSNIEAVNLEKMCKNSLQSLQLTPFTVMGWSEGSRTAVHVAGKGEAAKVNRMILLAACTRMSLVATNAVRGHFFLVAEILMLILKKENISFIIRKKLIFLYI